MKKLKLYLLSLISISTSACFGMPEKVKPVTGFELDKYLGTWYEVARLDHVFERGMDSISANYTLRDDGGVKVINKGFVTKKNKWKKAIGKAYFVGEQDVGHLKVAFFGPLYGSYVIFELDKKDYQYAFISGPNLSYLWFLSRTPEVSPELKELFIKRASEVGFNTNELIFVSH